MSRAPEDHDVTQILKSATSGRKTALNQLLTIVYEELRQMAQRKMHDERLGHTLGATALVHEVYLRLVNQDEVRWKDRTHFLAVAAQAARRVLIDHARASRRQKRRVPGGATPLSAVAQISKGEDLDILAVHEALESLARDRPIEARIVEMRFFAGMSINEIAVVLAMSDRTIRRRWSYAKAWLYREISKGDSRPLGEGER